MKGNELTMGKERARIWHSVTRVIGAWTHDRMADASMIAVTKNVIIGQGKKLVVLSQQSAKCSRRRVRLMGTLSCHRLFAH